jgi:hypothetical protein
MAQKQRPPPLDQGDGPQNECPAKQLGVASNDNRSQRQQPRIPRERLNNLAGRLHDLGPRPLAEFLAEIEAGANLHERLQRYSELWALRGFIEANGGNRLPQPILIAGRRP